MHFEEAGRSGGGQAHLPFEALLAVSGNATELPPGLGAGGPDSPKQVSSHLSKQSASSLDGGMVQRLQDPVTERVFGVRGRSQTELQRALELQGSKPEGVGTSGGGESGDTPNSSDVSREPDGDEYPREESSEVHMGQVPAGSGWTARSPRRDRRRQRMVWTAELHERFLNAVNHLGVKNAVPKTILRMMNVEGMTRENVASHLQKYRLHLRRHLGSGGTPLALDPPSEPPARAADTLAVAPGLPLGSFPVLLANMPSLAGTGAPALGLPICNGPSAFSSVHSSRPLTTSYIPPQAWAAGVPGYDALQAIQKLASGAHSTGGYAVPPEPGGKGPLPGLDPQERPAACEQWRAPVLDIAPLASSPPSSAGIS